MTTAAATAEAEAETGGDVADSETVAGWMPEAEALMATLELSR